jgi:hypothetical protein
MCDHWLAISILGFVLLRGRRGGGRQESSFCEQKEAKKLFPPPVSMPGLADRYPTGPNGQKFFWFFFFKKRTACFPSRPKNARYVKLAGQRSQPT